MRERPTTVTETSFGPLEYRFEERGRSVVLILHGGHMRASLPLGEELFAAAGCSVLAPSRPGYGRTPSGTGPSPSRFADAVTELCAGLGIERLTAVVGQSAGGPTAMTLASRHPVLVERLVLESAVGFLPWPDRRARLGGRLVFAPLVERASWSLVHGLVRRVPQAALHLLLRDLTTGPIADLVSGLSAEHRALLLDLFARMRSGSGFTADLRYMARGGKAPLVTQPTLIIAAPGDGAVPFAQAEALAAAIPGARLLTSTAPSHFIWFGDDYPAITTVITDFLTQARRGRVPGPAGEKGT
ncbi:alpha/beta fold hydrolase [Actinomadura verrucosospora]|uniref:Alpha/beta hydrolase fold protein n=1 Tax=Actinomadura verrucosospora TaxID=46165 RepID=A0A7D4AJH3_ACTVE|nr:alpha/beta hydrolase [Actinomadura verrucosospora]QKG20168.1 alpha/beta hydrolase fold protein [Actinomadura verrucosospora]